MDPNYKPPSDLGVAKLPSRKPFPRFSITTTQGQSPRKFQLNSGLPLVKKKNFRFSKFLQGI